MISLQIIEEPGNPVISSWIASEGHYAFIEFRNADEANLGFRLHGMNINGSEIKIGRPKAYEDTMQQIGLKQGVGLGAINNQPGDNPDGNEGQDGEEEKQLEGTVSNDIFQVSLPCTVLVIKNIAYFGNTMETDEF